MALINECVCVVGLMRNGPGLGFKESYDNYMINYAHLLLPNLAT